jgi:hypothetical protein
VPSAEGAPSDSDVTASHPNDSGPFYPRSKLKCDRLEWLGRPSVYQLNNFLKEFSRVSLARGEGVPTCVPIVSVRQVPRTQLTMTAAGALQATKGNK